MSTEPKTRVNFWGVGKIYFKVCARLDLQVGGQVGLGILQCPCLGAEIYDENIQILEVIMVKLGVYCILLAGDNHMNMMQSAGDQCQYSTCWRPF